MLLVKAGDGNSENKPDSGAVCSKGAALRGPNTDWEHSDFAHSILVFPVQRSLLSAQMNGGKNRFRLSRSRDEQAESVVSRSLVRPCGLPVASPVWQ